MHGRERERRRAGGDLRGTPRAARRRRWGARSSRAPSPPRRGPGRAPTPTNRRSRRRAGAARRRAPRRPTAARRARRPARPPPLSSSSSGARSCRRLSCARRRMMAAVPTSATAALAAPRAASLRSTRAPPRRGARGPRLEQHAEAGLVVVHRRPAAPHAAAPQAPPTGERRRPGRWPVPAAHRPGAAARAVPNASAAGELDAPHAGEPLDPLLASACPRQPTVTTGEALRDHGDDGAAPGRRRGRTARPGCSSRSVSSRGASKCRVMTVSTPGPTRAAGRTTVTARPGWTLRGPAAGAARRPAGRRPGPRPARRAQRCVVRQRHRVVRQRAVRHGAGDHHEVAGPRPRPRR